MKILNLLNGRLLAMVFALTALVFITSCGDDDGGDDGDTTPTPTSNLYDTLVALGNFTQLIDFVDEDAELLGYLQGTTEYTLFAPNDAAFDKLKATLGVTDLNTIAPSVIGGVLRFHFITGTLTSDDLLGSSATTLQLENVSVTEAGFVNEAGSDVDGSEILTADILATNGVAHEVETILIPPTVFVQIGLNLGTLAQPVLLGADFTDVVGIIAVADSDVPVGETAVASVLADRTGQYTAFIPTNDVLTGVAAALEISKEDLIASVTPNAATARAFLLNHVTDSKILAADLENGAQVAMLSGLNIQVVQTEVSEATPLGWVLVSLNEGQGQAPLYAADAYKAFDTDGNELDGALNGALHVSSIIQ